MFLKTQSGNFIKVISVSWVILKESKKSNRFQKYKKGYDNFSA